MAVPHHLVIVRHGESEANTLQLASKRGDHSLYTPEVAAIPDHAWRLTPRGVRQVQATGAWLQEALPPFQHFLVSPFTRTRETAAHLGLPRASWEEARVVRERSWGELSSLSRQAFQEHYPLNHSLREHDFLYWAPPAGESLASVAEGRATALLKRLEEEAGGENVVVVTHGDFTWATRLLLEEWTDEELVERDKDPAWKIHNGHVQHYTSIDPTTGRPTGRLSWTRRAWPVEAGDGTFTMEVSEWEESKPRRWSNEELLAKAHSRSLLFPEA